MSKIKYVSSSGLTHYDEKIKKVIDEVDTSTNTKVTQTPTSSNETYPLLLSPTGQTSEANTTSYFNSDVVLNPSTKTISANIDGNAETATKAVQDGDGNTITTTYVKETPEFTESTERNNIESKESMPTILGKIMKYFTDLKSHAFNALANNLTTTTEGYALDARQGKTLQDKIGSTDISTIGDGTVTNAISTINSNLTTNASSNIFELKTPDYLGISAYTNYGGTDYTITSDEFTGENYGGYAWDFDTIIGETYTITLSNPTYKKIFAGDIEPTVYGTKSLIFTATSTVTKLGILYAHNGAYSANTKIQINIGSESLDYQTYKGCSNIQLTSNLEVLQKTKQHSYFNLVTHGSWYRIATLAIDDTATLFTLSEIYAGNRYNVNPPTISGIQVIYTPNKKKLVKIIGVSSEGSYIVNCKYRLYCDNNKAYIDIFGGGSSGGNGLDVFIHNIVNPTNNKNWNAVTPAKVVTDLDESIYTLLDEITVTADY